MDRLKWFATKITIFILLLFTIITAKSQHYHNFNQIGQSIVGANGRTDCVDTIFCSVQTKLGQVVGKKLKTIFGDSKNVKFCSYRGIPYGKRPVGNLRFKVIRNF